MKFYEMETMLLKSASMLMKKKGNEAFKCGLVSDFKGKKIQNTYHIYGKVKNENKTKEFSTHITFDIYNKKKLGISCSCEQFKEGKLNNYSLMCEHITATCYKFLNIISRGKDFNKKNKKDLEKYEGYNNENTKLIRKEKNNNIYYEVISNYSREKLIIYPNKLKEFLLEIKLDKIKFKYDYMEIKAPIFHKDLPLTFNIKADGDVIILTSHKHFPVSLNENNDVFYYKNELYIPSKKQVDNYLKVYDKLKNKGKIVFEKNINIYNNLLLLISNITKKINIEESLKNFWLNSLKPEFIIFERNNKIYLKSFINYGNKNINILSNDKENQNLRDYRKEEKIIMELEKINFIKRDDYFIFLGNDEEAFNILTNKEKILNTLGKVIFNEEFNLEKIYNNADIEGQLDYNNLNEYNFSFNINGLDRKDFFMAFNSFKNKEKFFKSSRNKFIDFENEDIKKFFNLIEVLDVKKYFNEGKIQIEKSKSLYLYENIKVGNFNKIKISKNIEKLPNKFFNINNLNVNIPNNFKGKLRSYQLSGFKWFKTLSNLGFGGILADEMGLGKTIQAITFLLEEKNKKALIVVPTSLIYNWKEEIEKFAPDLNPLIIHGKERKNNISCIKDENLILTTYGTLKMDIDEYKNIDFDYFIIDEGQNIKNYKSLNSKTVKKIKSKIRFVLTGTPIENNLMEIWSIFDFIMPGYLYSKEKFQEKFINDKENGLINLKEIIKPFILRRTKKEVIHELRDKKEEIVLVEMTQKQKKLYNGYIKKVREVIKNNKNGKLEMLSYLTKLRQIALDPSLIFEEYIDESSKIKILLDLIKENVRVKDKTLIFSQFISVLDKIGQKLKENEIDFFILNGKTAPKERIKKVKEFNQDDKIKVFLISLKAGGTGLNLTSANKVIHFDPWWNPAVEDQATDRAHRIGQKKIVNVIKLIAKDSIEEKIVLLKEDKKELIDSILTGELKNNGLLKGLSREELIKLFDKN